MHQHQGIPVTTYLKKKKQIHIADQSMDLTLNIYRSCLTPSSYLGRNEIDAVQQDQLA